MRGRMLHASALALVAAAIGPRPLAQGATGRIAGRVRLTARLPGTPLPSTAYPKRTIGQHDAKPIPEIRNVVVYLKGVTFKGPLTPRHAELRQEHESFAPHILAITRGSTVDFPNDDPFFHNVFSLSGAASFNLGRYPQGQTKGREFTRAGTVKVFCDIHSHMSATILVFDHPYFSIPELDGSYELTGVPPGQYTIVGWHERVGERVERVSVEAQRTTSLDLSVPIGDEP